MAFNMVEQTVGGATVSFHRVVSTTLDVSTGAAEAVLHSWESQAAAERGARHVLVRKFTFVPDGGPLHQAAETQILTDPYWAAAEVL